MAIDTSIYGQIRQPEIESPVNALAKVTQLKNEQNQNRLFDMKVDEANRSMQSENALADAYRNATKPDGTIDRNMLITSLAQGGQGAKLPAIQKTFSEQDKSARDAEKAGLETAMQKQGIIAQYAGSAKDQPSWTAAKQALSGMGIDVSQVPDQYDPNTAQTLLQRSLTGVQQLEQAWKQKGFDLDVAKFGYQQKNDAANRGVTIRGQNMTDARMRDANDIKREDKKATAEQAKAGQVASFDTMLGTLDRLAVHPGLSRSVGVVGAFPTSPGSDSANFQAELNTFQSQAFLPMVAQLKGMGALSDAEGKKLTAAVGALDPKMGEKAFRDSVSRITRDMEAARARVAGTPREKAQQQSAPIQIKSAIDYEKIPSGTTYIDPNGQTRRKP